MRKKTFTLIALLGTILATFAQQPATNFGNTKQIDTVHRNISPVQADSLINANIGNPDLKIMDVRTPAEFATGYINGAFNLNYNDTPTFVATTDTMNRDKIYLVYCGSGSRSAKARDTMIHKHYVNVYNLQYGISSWISAGYPVSTLTALDNLYSNNTRTAIYPNPVVDVSTLHIEYISNNSCTVKIFDVMGRLMKENTITANEISISNNDYPKGIYFYRVMKDEAAMGAGKFTVE